MSADEDTELRDLVAQTLETNGVLGKIRAQLRASVFLALEEQENVQGKTPFTNPDLKRFLSTKEGRACAGLVREFLEYFKLEFTLAVFEPEAGLSSNNDGRECLARELGISESDGPPKGPLLAEVVRRGQGGGDKSSFNRSVIAEELTSKQLADARKKFEYYDKDRNGEIDKDELRELFTDLFPSFHRNMLDRYVNDEFKAADKDFSSSISFEEFLGMYKRLFLLCRTVVSGEVSDIVSNKQSPLSSSSPSKSLSESKGMVDSKNQKNLQSSHLADVRNGPKQSPQDLDLIGGSDIEEDPFFDDPLTPTGSGGSGGIRSSTNNDNDRNKDTKTAMNGSKSPGAGGGSSGLSSLQGLPALTQTRRKSQETVAKENLQAMDRGMADLGLDGEGDFDYDDDFQSSGHSLSNKSPRTLSKSEQKSVSQNENGSIAEEIEEEIDEISIEADDLLKSERSAFDDLTTDRTISQHDGFDYMEDIQSP